MVDSFLYLIAGFIAGIVFEYFLPFGWSFAAFGLIFSSTLFYSYYRSADQKFLVWFLLIFAFAGGYLRGALVLPIGKDLDFWVGQTKEVKLKIITDPEERDTYQQFIGRVGDSRARVVVRLPRSEKFQIGDDVSLRGKISLPKFQSYAEWLAIRGVRYELAFAKIISHETAKDPSIKKISQDETLHH